MEETELIHMWFVGVIREYGGETVQLEQSTCVIQVFFFGQELVPSQTSHSTVMTAMTVSQPLKPIISPNVGLDSLFFLPTGDTMIKDAATTLPDTIL